MSFVEMFIVFVLVIILVSYINNYVNSEVEYVKSRVDGRSYLVLSLPDKQEAADYLAEINQDLIKLIKHLKAKYPDNEDYDRLYNNYDPDRISEGSPDSSYTSYTVNKRALVVCLRHDDEKKTFVESNVLKYVAIHEINHMSCDEYNHTPKFWALFKHVLNEAVSIGLYTKVDYKAKPAPYCGITLNSSVI